MNIKVCMIGWDTKDYSAEHVSNAEAANYLIRSYLLALGAGVEKCFWFIFKDLDTVEKPIVFSSSGLFENENFPLGNPTRLKPKTTYWYNATFKKLTGGYFFQGDVLKTDDSTVYQYRFYNADRSKQMIVAWYCPKMRNRWIPDPPPQLEKKNHSFALPAGYKLIKAVRPAEGTTEGMPAAVTTGENSIELTLTTTPVFIEMGLK